MEQLIISRLSFYFCIILYFTGSFINLEALNCITEQNRYLDYSHNKIISDLEILDVYTTLRVVRDVHDDVQSQLSQNNQLGQHDFIVDIMAVCVGMYEKIVGATVTYYLMAYLPMHQNLHDIVGKIIAEGIIEITSILSRQLIHYIFNQNMTLREKIWYCGCAISIIGLIKIGIDQIPQIMKPESCMHDSSQAIPEHVIYNLPNPIYDFNKIRRDESVYLKGKNDI